MKIVFHVTQAHLAPDGGLSGVFYRNLQSDFVQAGFQTEAVHRQLPDLAGLNHPDRFHFVHNGRISHPRVLNTGYGYLGSYWYADPQGVFGDSSITGLPFDESTVRYKPASAFFDRLVARLVATRHSRYNQPKDVRRFPGGAIAIFLQGISDPVERARHMTARAMVVAVLADTRGRAVIVKPHPGNDDQETRQLVRWLRRDHPDVIVTDANVHDILADCAVSVSLCSAASLEGMLHRKPAVLFGRADFHHCAQTVQVPADWPAALDRALGQAVPYRKYLYWFFAQNLIDARHKGRFARIRARMQASGAALPG